MIVKLEDHNDNYSITSNKVYQGSGLSFRAMGLMGYLLTKKRNWRIIPEAISKDTGESVSMVRKVLKELRSKGYADLKFNQNGSGGSNYIIYESPELRDSEIDEMDNSDGSEIHETRDSQNVELSKTRDSQSAELSETLISGNTTENQQVTEIHKMQSSAKQEIHEMETIVNTDYSVKDIDNNNSNISITQKGNSAQKEISEKSDTRNSLKTETESFGLFWEHYGKKVGKKKAFAEWKKLSLEQQRTAYQFLTAYTAVREKKYRKDPERYLHHKVWENDEQILEDYKKLQSTKNQRNHGNQHRKTQGKTSRLRTTRPS